MLFRLFSPCFHLRHVTTEYHPHLQRVLGPVITHGQAVAHTLCYVNSAINPILYYMMSDLFKKKVINKWRYKIWVLLCHSHIELRLGLRLELI